MSLLWTMNTSQLSKGMLIRRPGLDEALEVVNVRDGQAKIKLPGGKTSTITASAEVEWCWPETSAKPIVNSKPETETVLDPEPDTDEIDTESEIDTDWLSDWNLLDVGKTISILGENGTFRVLRMTGSEARIKSDKTAQISSLTVGHKFKIIGGDTETESDDSTAIAKSGKKTKSAKSRKTRSDKGTKVAVPDSHPEPDTAEDSRPALFEDADPEPEEIEPLPSDEELEEIENGDYGNHDLDDDDLQSSSEDADHLDDDIEFEDDDIDDEQEETTPMPKTTAKPSRSTPSAPRSTSGSGTLLTLGQISAHTGISYPTLVRYVRDHGDRLPSEGEGRSRRYYPDAIDVFREIRSETKGGRKPGSGAGNKAKAATGRKPKPMPVNPPEREHSSRAAKSLPPGISSSDSSSAGTSGGSTIDQALAQAIDHAKAQISGLESLIDNLEAQRESLKLWS